MSFKHVILLLVVVSQCKSSCTSVDGMDVVYCLLFVNIELCLKQLIS